MLGACADGLCCQPRLLPGGCRRCCTHPDRADADVSDQARETEDGGERRYNQITAGEIRRATAPGQRGGVTEYDSAPRTSPPLVDRGLQPSVLEAGYGGPDSVMNMAGARPRSRRGSLAGFGDADA